MDMLWVLLAALLVFFMQLGFMLVEVGFSRSKNAVNITMKNVMDFAVGSIAFFVVGFGLMWGLNGCWFCGTRYFLPDTAAVTAVNPDLGWAFYLFQCVFCATAATIVSGAMAERTKFTSYLVYSAVISSVIYPIFGAWTWGGGWLAEAGFHDFAGSTIVHSVGGWLALTGALTLGPRIGKYGPEGTVNAIPGHHLTMGALGVLFLWFGWFGFNPGSTCAVTPAIGYIAVTTNLAAAAGAIAAMGFAWAIYGKSDATMTLNGILAGLVAITAGCDVVSPVGAILIGAVAGVLVVGAILFIDRVLKIDDPVGAVSVHGVCGIFGTLMVGLFATEGGLFYGGGCHLLWVQCEGVLAAAIWAGGLGLLLFHAIKYTIGLRVSRREELRGLDIEEHGMQAYPDFDTWTTT
ncbi:MAG: ammonium transporter [Planctomycetia bacterium]|nr:ammonium transporter [Planctomycetia bacterium]